MKIDIFIRTYHKDLDWLKYCLRSISKFVTGYNEIIICIPEQEAHLLDEWNLTNERIVKWKPVTDIGYIDQQISKLSANFFSDADYILYVDSDVCFNVKTDLNELFRNDLPILMKTRYELVGDAICWKKPTEDILGFQVEFEYMRRLPTIYRTDTLLRLFTYVKGYEAISQRETLSEFNLLGAFAEKHHSDKYYILDTEKEELPPVIAKQGWSWGGITPEIKNELETILK